MGELSRDPFTLIDTDKDECVTLDESKAFLTVLQLDIPEDQVEKYFNLVDSNGDGCITKEEIGEFILTQIFKAIVFDQMDKDGDGCVTKEEFGILKSLGKNPG